ncbi:biopolymer transporter ExbD, partial [Leptolyngbya cf. ectocarpi LEGE 11479]
MGLKSRHQRSGIPEVNLVPMMDVLMTVLTFFVIISMELSGVQIFGVSLPQA